jgi:hypothetical protein
MNDFAQGLSPLIQQAHILPASASTLVCAHKIARPRQYPCSSFAANALGLNDDLITPHESWLVLYPAPLLPSLQLFTFTDTGEEGANFLLIAYVFLSDLSFQVLLLKMLNADIHVDGGYSRKQKMSGGHGGRSPEANHKAGHDGMTNKFVEEKLFKACWLVGLLFKI